MTTLTAVQPFPEGRVRLRPLGDIGLWLAVFSGGFVFIEPSPYELVLVLLIPAFLFAGLPVRASSGPLLAGLMLFAAGGFLSVTRVSPDLVTESMIYMAVSLFLCLTSVFFAAVVAEDWTRIRIIEKAYVAAGLVTAIVGALAYFRVMPDAESYLLYGRARSTFKDPNVFGPFLVLPALILARRMMTGPILTRPLLVGAYLILLTGVFLSFSRAAWGLLAVTTLVLAMVVSATASGNRARLRLAGLAVAGVATIALFLLVAMQIPAVEDLLSQRARIVQDYDSASGDQLGRFARHWAGFQMAASLPFGLGPFEFPRLYVEATHNTWLKALLEYGWLGFGALVAVVLGTIRRAARLLIEPHPWQGFAQCVSVCFFGHLAVGWVIDMDHWRHVFLLIGLIWGLSAAGRPAVVFRRS